MKPVLTYQSFHLYNEYVKNIIAVGSYHLEGKTLRILFGECLAGGLDCSGDCAGPGGVTACHALLRTRCQRVHICQAV